MESISHSAGLGALRPPAIAREWLADSWHRCAHRVHHHAPLHRDHGRAGTLSRTNLASDGPRGSLCPRPPMTRFSVTRDKGGEPRDEMRNSKPRASVKSRDLAQMFSGISRREVEGEERMNRHRVRVGLLAAVALLMQTVLAGPIAAQDA